MTAEEFALQQGIDYEDFTITHEFLMVDFAKLKVEEALEAAAKEAKLEVYNFQLGKRIYDKLSYSERRGHGEGDSHNEVKVHKDSIINSYPLDNIK